MGMLQWIWHTHILKSKLLKMPLWMRDGQKKRECRKLVYVCACWPFSGDACSSAPSPTLRLTLPPLDALWWCFFLFFIRILPISSWGLGNGWPGSSCRKHVLGVFVRNLYLLTAHTSALKVLCSPTQPSLPTINNNHKRNAKISIYMHSNKTLSHFNVLCLLTNQVHSRQTHLWLR